MRILSIVTEWLRFAWAQLSDIHVTDIVDILLLTVVFFGVYRFLRDRRAGNLAWGVIVLALIWLVAALLDFYALTFLLRCVFEIGILALIVVFQPEIRSGLEKVGDRPFHLLTGGRSQKNKDEFWDMTGEITNAVFDMAQKDKNGEFTGALIVLERTTKLGEFLQSGVAMDAKVSAALLRTIFYKGTPVHDGAVFIRDGRIAAAGCYLPPTQSVEMDKELGARHRAAIGMSENSDALVIVVSEETGRVSVAFEGTLTTDYNRTTLKRVLAEKLASGAADAGEEEGEGQNGKQ